MSLVTGNRPQDWLTLGAFLDRIAGRFPPETQAWRLERPHDHDDYRKLLHTTWCYVGRLRAELKPGFSSETTGSQQAVLDQAVGALSRVKNCKNVLCYGKANNAKTMTSPAWELLLSRVGDTVMLHLLLSVSMFATLENGCYFQLSGEPVLADARATKRASVYQMGPEFRADSERRREGRVGRAKAAGKGPGSSGQVDRGGSGDGLVEAVAAHVGEKRRSRPPKWQRARYLKQMRGGGEEKVGTGKAAAGRPGLALPTGSKPKKKRYGNLFSDNTSKTNKMQTPSEMQVHRHAMFYKQQQTKRCGLPRSNILLRLDKGSEDSGKALYRCIFSPKLNPVARKYNHLKGMPEPHLPKRFPWRNRHMIPLLTSMVNKAHASQKSMGRLLDLHCPMIKPGVQDAGEDAGEQDKPATDPWSSPSFRQVPHKDVSSFVWSALRRIVPKRLLGGRKAQRVMRRSVTTFVRLKRFESITVHRLMHKLPLTDLPWLYALDAKKDESRTSPSTQAKQVKMAAMWVGWVFGALVVPLLRTHFYCTENESFRQETFYYRKPVWSKMIGKAFEDTLGATFVPVARNVAREALESRKIGVARLRFLPKQSGMRFLMNMSKGTVAKFKSRGSGYRAKTPPVTLKFGPINQRLKLTLSVLQCEARRQPEAFGSSTYGFNDIFCRYKPFVRRWHADRVKAIQLGRDPADLEPPYAVCVDVSKAFDNVDVETLLGICSELLTAEKYTILKFTEIMTVMGNVKVNHRNVAVPSHEVQDGHFTQHAAQMANGQKNRIFLDCITEESITRAHIMKVLRQYLSMNLIWIKKKWRRQSKGIAQGAKPSTLLCSLYLGYVERVCLNPLIASCGVECRNGPVPRATRAVGEPSMDQTRQTRPATSVGATRCPDPSHTLLLRMVDDWLLISRHKSVVEQFAARTIEGIPGFNIIVNPLKTQTTVPLEYPRIGLSIQPDLVTEADGARFIKWCGLLIDVRTLELRADYTRYSSAHMRTTVNMPVARKPGLALGSKICHYIRPKILAVLLDEEINSKLTVRLNVHQIFMLGAMKMHSFLASLPQPPVPGAPCDYIMSAIDVGIKYMIKSTRPKVILRASANTSSAECDPRLPHAHVEYLALKAFHRIFKTKASRYPDLLGMLEERMSCPRMARVAQHLGEVVSEDHSGVFRGIKC